MGVVLTLDERYADACATPSDIYLHLPRLVDLVMSTNAQHVIELGTRTGVSTLAFLHALARTGGTLTSVDLDARPDIGTHERWQFIQGDDMAPEVLAQLAPADIVFIDTSHHYEHTRLELATYRWLVRPGGYLVLHDTELAHPEGAPPSPAFPVRQAIDEFTAAERLAWVNVPECWGLGIIRMGNG